MANIGPIGILRHIDDPSITVLSDTAGAGQTWITDSDSGDTDFLKATVAGKGLYYIGVLSATDDRMIEFSGNSLQFFAQEGHCEVEILLQFSAVTDLAFNFGFNDQVLETANSIPMEISTTDVISANSASFVGFALDTDSTTDNLYCCWVDDGSVGQLAGANRVNGKPIRMPTMTVTAAKWLYLKVELDDMGSGNKARANFLAVDHNGNSEERTFNTTLDRDVPLAYYFGAENRGDTGHTIYIRCPNWAQTIPNM